MLFPYLWLRSTGFPFQWLDDLALPALLDPAAPDYHDRAAFDAQVIDSRRRLVEALGRPDAVEALLLSNVSAVDRLGALSAADLTRPNLRTRQRLRLAWCYLQRFCAKNETCAFFGPLAWGRVDPDSPLPVELGPHDPGLGWLRRRMVRIEHWVIERLCDQLGRRHPAALPYQLNPGCDLEGDQLRVPLGKQVTLSAPALRFLRSVAAGRGEQPVPPEPALRALATSGVVHRTVGVAPESERPLERIDDALGVRLPVTTQLEELRGRFEQKTGHPDRRAVLEEMLAALREAGVDTTRATGTTYAGRLPVYEDCERNLRFRIGGELADVLRTRIPPLLRLYRLVAECVASVLHEHYATVLTELRDRAGSAAPVDFLVFLNAARSAAIEDVRRGVGEEVRAVLHAAWAACAGDPTADELVLQDDHLDRVATQLRAGFPGHRGFAQVLGIGVMSPDVMIGIGDGGVRVVLGEVHPCVLAAMQPVALPFLDQRADALARVDELLGAGRIVLAATRQTYQRSQLTWPVTAKLFEVVLPGATSRCPPAQQIPAGRGRVELRDGVVHFFDRATGRAEDMVTLLSSDLQHVMFGLAGDVLGGGLAARLRYRDVVVRRRSWRVGTDDLPAASRPAEEFDHYRALRGWAENHGLPRRGFFRTDSETKPVYLDWANPIAVDTFAKMARASSRVTITEMDPAPDQLWLADHSGLHTAELRMSYVV